MRVHKRSSMYDRLHQLTCVHSLQYKIRSHRSHDHALNRIQTEIPSGVVDSVFIGLEIRAFAVIRVAEDMLVDAG